MPKQAQKNSKQQDPQNRLNTGSSVGTTDSPYQASAQGMGTSSNNSNTQEVFISDDDIQKRAYEIHQQKGGSDIDNWLEAERALREEQGSNSR